MFRTHFFRSLPGPYCFIPVRETENIRNLVPYHLTKETKRNRKHTKFRFVSFNKWYEAKQKTSKIYFRSFTVTNDMTWNLFIFCFPNRYETKFCLLFRFVKRFEKEICIFSVSRNMRTLAQLRSFRKVSLFYETKFKRQMETLGR